MAGRATITTTVDSGVPIQRLCVVHGPVAGSVFPEVDLVFRTRHVAAAKSAVVDFVVAVGLLISVQNEPSHFVTLLSDMNGGYQSAA
jgi:hypothetical protein